MSLADLILSDATENEIQAYLADADRADLSTDAPAEENDRYPAE